MATKKKPATKKATTKKPVAKKNSASKKPATKKPVAKKTTATKAKPKTATTKTSIATRRPDPNLPPSVATIDSITNEILFLITRIENYAANLRALDRQRHNGVGLRRLGFIEAALRLSSKFPQYFPHWLNTAAKKPEAFWLGVCA